MNDTPQPFDIPIEIGPHEGQELKLLLAGKKPLAMFSDVVPASFEWGEETFQPYVETGRIIKYEEIIHHAHPALYPGRYVYFALPGEEWRIDRLSVILHMLFVERLKTTPAIETEIGRLLGYAEHEIAVYVERFFVARPWED